MHLGGVEGHVADVDRGLLLGGEVGVDPPGRVALLCLDLTLLDLTLLDLTLALLGDARGLREIPAQGQCRSGLRRANHAGADREGSDLLAGDSDGSHRTGRSSESGTTDRIPGGGWRPLVFFAFLFFSPSCLAHLIASGELGWEDVAVELTC